MLLARRNNDSDWLSNFFDDTLFNTEVMPRMNATAPAINIKEFRGESKKITRILTNRNPDGAVRNREDE